MVEIDGCDLVGEIGDFRGGLAGACWRIFVKKSVIA